jgi:hypothetical protein
MPPTLSLRSSTSLSGQRSHQLSHIRLHRRLSVAVGNTRDAEVEDLRLSAFVHEDVAGFEITMDQTPLVCVMDGIANLDGKFQPLPRVQMMQFGVLAQFFAANELHSEVRLGPKACICGAGIVNLRDGGMLQAAKRLRLRACQARLDDFQRDGSAGLILLRFVNGAHSAFADETRDLVAPNLPDALWVGRRRRGTGGLNLYESAQVVGIARGSIIGA